MDWGTITANIVALLSAVLAYNQYTKNKLTDAKIERWKRDEEQKNVRRSDNAAKIYGVMWQLLHDLSADRVYILQPHPLTNSLFVSISLEVKRNGIAPMKPVVQSMPMGDIAAFGAELASRDFLYYRNVNEEVRDKRARALLSTNGGLSAIIRRLSDDDHDWTGSLFLEFTHRMECEPVYARKALSDAAEAIQYILPEIKNRTL